MQMRSRKKTAARVVAWMAGMLAVTAASFAFATPRASVENDPRIDARIIGGNEVSRGKYPFMASLQFDGQHFCGGSLYRRNVVITAAHCVDDVTDDNAEEHTVTIGQTLLSDDIGVQRRGIRAVAISTIPDSDLALVFLDRAVSGVVPVSLPTLGSDALYRPGQMATVMGWGNTDADLPFFPNRLREVDVPVLASEECAASYEEGKLSTYFCAGVRGKDSCQGDSGGPVIRSIGGRVYQIGVVSFGEGCAEQGAPGVYVNLSSGDLWSSLRFTWIQSTGDERRHVAGSNRR